MSSLNLGLSSHSAIFLITTLLCFYMNCLCLYMNCLQLLARGRLPRQRPGGSCGEDDSISELVRSEPAPGLPAGGWGKN